LDRSSELAVGGLGAVLALVVVVGYIPRDAGFGRSEQHAAEGEAGDVLKEVGVLDGFRGGSAPGEGGMAGDQNAGNGDGIKVPRPEAADETAPVECS